MRKLFVNIVGVFKAILDLGVEVYSLTHPVVEHQVDTTTGQCLHDCSGCVQDRMILMRSKAY